jgi:prophage regulatory protein
MIVMPERLLPLQSVKAMVGIGTSAIYERMAEGTFPLPVKEGTRSLWVESEIQAWIRARIDARNMGRNMGQKKFSIKKAA